MITKFEQYNESIKDLLVGPTKEEVLKNFGYEQNFETPEEFIIHLIKNSDVKKKRPLRFSNYVFIVKDDNILFRSNTKMNDILVNTGMVWYILNIVFNLNNEQIQPFLKKMIKKHIGYEKLGLNSKFTVWPTHSYKKWLYSQL